MSMNMIKNDSFLRACRREPTSHTPIWMMRQAGRYLPEYRKVREKAGDFMSLCRSPEYCCEVTLQPITRYGFDAAIIFSDILTIPDAMGLGLQFLEGEGPVFSKPVVTAEDIQRLPIPDPNDDLRYVMDAIKVTKSALANSIPLIGFAGSPFTLATYMVEGGSSKQFHKIKKLLFSDPALGKVLLDKLTESVSIYLLAQIDAGADAVMVFDSWGGVLSTPAYREFSLAPMQKIVQTIKSRASRDVPVLLFTKQGGLWLEEMAETGCDVLGLDWTIELADARARVGDKVALQGNLDPAMLLAPVDKIQAATRHVMRSYGNGPGHIFNLGHGLTPDVPPEHVTACIEAVRQFDNER